MSIGEAKKHERPRRPRRARARVALDWREAATALLDAIPAPCALADERGRILARNPAFSQAGYAGAALEKRVDELCPPVLAAVKRLRRAPRDAREVVECAPARTSRAPSVTAEIVGLGSRAGGPFLVTVLAERDAHGAVHFQGDAHYDISALANDFGRLRGGWSRGRPLTAFVGKRCYEVLHGRPAPCGGCPALAAPGPAARPALFGHERRDAPFELVSATPLDASTTRITVRLLPASLLSELARLHLDLVARERRLSARETEVLHALVGGRSAAEIAGELGIAARTVRFHQGRILEKLGASSRADLLRLVS